MKIRVLHVIDHLGYGGAPLVVKGLVEAMPSDHVESFVCALRPNKRAIDIRATVQTLNCHKYSLATVQAIVRLCAEHEIDIVHAHLQKAFISSLLAARRCGGALILHEHGPIFRGGTGCLYRLSLKLLGTRAKTIIANSQAAGRAVQRVLGPADVPVVVVPNSVDLQRFDPARYDRQIVRGHLGLGEDDFVVGFVGRLDRAKGADLLIEAAAHLRDRQEVCRFYLVGDGGQRRALERQVRKRGLGGIVTFGGLCENPAEIMRAFDVAVVPSRREAFGVAALELMRMKVPVIVSPVGGLPELVEDGRTGIVLPEPGVSAIASAIRSLRRNRSRLAALAEAAFRRTDAFERDKVVQQILNVYENIACPTKEDRGSHE